MRIRAIDTLGDWEFGKGQNDYKQGVKALTQNIQTRLYEFLGDCFFRLTAGIDWFNLLSSKDQITLNLSISAVILNTPDVIRLRRLDAVLDPVTRNFYVSYEVDSSFGTTIADDFTLNPTLT